MSDKNMDLNSNIIRNKEIIFSEMDEDIVMMSIEKGEYYGLNPVGRRIWEILENPSIVKIICKTLTNEFNVPAEQCEQEVFTFINKLKEKNIIKIVD